MNVTTIGVDLAKNSFSLHGVDSRGKMVFRKTLVRAKTNAIPGPAATVPDRHGGLPRGALLGP
jgi:transposase